MKRRIINIIIIFTLIMFLLLDIAYASSLKVSMTQASSAVGEYTITVKVSDLDVGENGINALTATVDIPTGSFEDVTSANFTGLNNWTASYTADTKKITLFKTSFTKTNEDIFTIKLKTKSSAINVNGTIQLNDIIVSNGEDEINVEGASVQIGNSPTNTTNNTLANQVNLNTTNNKTNNSVILISNNAIKTNNVVNNSANKTNNTTNNSIINTSNYINKTYANNTAVNSSVPYTGVRENVRLVLIVLMIVCGYIYYRIQKMNKIC